MEDQAIKNQKPNVWQAKRVGTGTFVISKPKRTTKKIRQTRLRNKLRGR